MPFSASPPSLLFGNSAGNLLADSRGFLQIQWLPAAGELSAFRQLFEQLLRVLKQTGWGRVVADQQAFAPEQVHWLTTDWLPRAARQGAYRWCAVLAAVEAAGETSLDAAHHNNRIRVRYFACRQQAIDWLLMQ